MKALGAGLLAVAMAMSVEPAAAQARESDPVTDPNRWSLGAALGLPGFEGESAPLQLVTIAFHATNATRNRAGLDFALGTMPRLIIEGVLPIGIRGGVTTQLGPDGGSFWPSAGLSVAAAVGSGGQEAIAGAYVGGAVSVFGEGNETGLRFGVTLHRLSEIDGFLWLAEIGFMKRR